MKTQHILYSYKLIINYDRRDRVGNPLRMTIHHSLHVKFVYQDAIRSVSETQIYSGIQEVFGIKKLSRIVVWCILSRNAYRVKLQ